MCWKHKKRDVTLIDRSICILVYLWHLLSGSQIGPMKGQCSAPACWSRPESCWSASKRSETTEEEQIYHLYRTHNIAPTSYHPHDTRSGSAIINFNDLFVYECISIWQIFWAFAPVELCSGPNTAFQLDWCLYLYYIIYTAFLKQIYLYSLSCSGPNWTEH